jgi:dihydrofolate reductase
MAKLVVNEFLTLDGVMQSPGYPDEDPSGGFEHGGWHMPLMEQVGQNWIMQGLADTGGLLLGRVTYEIFAGYWPTAPAEDPLADTMNKLPKYVVSTTLQEPLEWNNSHLIGGDVPQEVRKLKDEPGQDIQVIGSGGLVQTLMQNDLVDEYRLMIDPLVLGTGKRLFREGIGKVPLRLVDSKISGTGVLIVTYQPDRQ